MKIGDFELNDNVMVIAEIGNNHEGSYALAEEMIGRAAEAGADAVKFQTLRAENIVSIADKARFKQLKSFELTFEQYESLSVTAKDAGVIFLSTPFDLESVDFLDGLVPAFKIASGDNTFYPLIEKAALTGKPMIISTGLSTFDEIEETRNFIENIWQENNICQQVALLHCVASYPVALEHVNLKAVTRLESIFNCTVGYSDHSVGIEAATLSVIAGARIIEKHFTLDKDQSSFGDHKLSADPQEMALLVEKVRELTAILGDGDVNFRDCEKDIIPKLRRSIVARDTLNAGHTLNLDDINWLRPQGGLAPGQEKKVLGRTLKKSVEKGMLILAEEVN